MSLFSRTFRRKNPRRWGLLLVSLVLLGILLLGLLLSYRQAAAAELLPVSIQSQKQADYSADYGYALQPALNLEIVQEVLRDKESTNVPERVEIIQEGLLTLVPSATPAPTSTPTQVGPTTTLPPGTTATPAQPTSILPSNTALPATATVPPIPTRTPTLAASSTPSNTAVNTPSPTSLAPTSTSTATLTPTLAPANTNTALVCLPPNSKTGFVSRSEPADGAAGVPVNTVVKVIFNQPIDQGSLAQMLKSKPNTPFTTSYNAFTRTLSINFTGGMEPDTKYTITLLRNLNNICGDRQETDVKFSFTTAH